MSYSIVYERQFIKLPNGNVIPLILVGDNNVYEGSGKNMRRSRDWCAATRGSNRPIDVNPDELMDEIKKHTGGTYQEHFKRGGKWVDDAAYIRFFENGIKDAKTIEELQAISVWGGIDLTAHLSVYSKSKVELDYSDIHEIENRTRIDSSESLVKFLEVGAEYIKANPSKTTYIVVSFLGDKAVYKEKRIKKPKARLTDYYVIYFRYMYVKKMTQKRLHGVNSSSSAKQFATEKAAQKWIAEKLSRGFDVIKEVPQIEHIVENKN